MGFPVQAHATSPPPCSYAPPRGHPKARVLGLAWNYVRGHRRSAATGLTAYHLVALWAPPRAALGLGSRGASLCRRSRCRARPPIYLCCGLPAEKGKDSSLGGWVHRMNTHLGRGASQGATWSARHCLSRRVQALRPPPEELCSFPGHSSQGQAGLPGDPSARSRGSAGARSWT